MASGCAVLATAAHRQRDVFARGVCQRSRPGDRRMADRSRSNSDPRSACRRTSACEGSATGMIRVLPRSRSRWRPHGRFVVSVCDCHPSICTTWERDVDRGRPRIPALPRMRLAETARARLRWFHAWRTLWSPKPERSCCSRGRHSDFRYSTRSRCCSGVRPRFRTRL